jgi:TPR repeat protein/serine/threonine protein kinase
MQCPGCFETKTNTACERCGYDETLKRSPLVLPHHTLLSNGRYQIGRVLGRPGGFGITYLAFDSRLQSLVAIKEYLPRELSARDGDHLTVSPHSGEEGELFQYGVGKFLEEARTLAKFDHPNVVRVRDFFEENGTAYLVMDYCRGLPLSQYVSQQEGGKVNINAAISILQPLLDALRELHKKGYLHRDVKPQNIYLSESGKPILLDFGAARQAMGDKSRSLSVVLSEGYAPLEQYQRNGMQGPWTDVYGAVATFYNLITGQTPPSAIDRINNPTAELNGSSAFDERIRLILNKGLHPDHAQRIQSVEDLQRLLISNYQTDNDTDKVREEAKHVKDNKTAWTHGEVKSEQSMPEPEDPAWNAVAPYYISALTGQKAVGNTLNDPDPKMFYWITSIVFMLCSIGAAVFGATLLNELIGFKNDEAVGLMVLFGFAGWGAAYAILSGIPSYSRMQRYRRSKAYLPVFQKLHAGKSIHKTGFDYVFIPAAWLGYWGLWKELFISLGAFFLIDSSPVILSFLFGAQNMLSVIIYKITEHSMFFFGFWLLMSYRYDGAIYRRITSQLYSFVDKNINDPEIIYGKTKPRLLYGFLSMSLFVLLFIGLETIMDPIKGEIKASISTDSGDYKQSFDMALRFYEEKKFEKAAEWAKPLSDRGYAPAQNMMGIFYEDGSAPEHAPKDPAKAFSLYKAAAEAGYKYAKRALADAYYFGIGVTHDSAAAFDWYMKAAADGEQEGLYKVGYLYWTGDGVKQNLPKAFEYMKKSADSGYPRAQGILGSFYQDGVGVKKDVASGIDYLKRAVAADDHVAQYYMGINYYYGDGVPKDPKKALDLFVKAANAGIPGAQYRLGAILVAGDIVAQDFDSGTAWLRKASAQGLDEATTLLKKLDNP